MYIIMKQLIITRRVTSAFLSSLPANVEEYSAYLYAVVARRPESIIPQVKYGTDVRIDPCYFDWSTKTITLYIPYNINPGIETVDDLDPSFYESIEAAFIALLLSISP